MGSVHQPVLLRGDAEMSYSNMVIREAEDREDEALDYDEAVGALWDHANSLGTSDLADLLIDVVGGVKARRMLLGLLEADYNTDVSESVVDWYKERQA